jgi:hypothetical protein
MRCGQCLCILLFIRGAGPLSKLKFFFIWLFKDPDEMLFRVAFFVVISSIFLTLPSFMIPLGMPPEGDAIDYRVPLMRWILRHQTFPVWDWTMIDDYPMFAEFLMLPFYALDPALARLVPIVSYAGLGACAGAFTVWLCGNQTKISSRTLFFLGAAWALTLRPLAIQSNLLMIDNAASFFLLASLYLILKQRILLAGVLAAFAAGTRYTVWPSLIILAIFLIVLSKGKKSFKFIFKEFLLFCLLGLAGALPFMLRNYYVNDGNPFFPIGSDSVWSSVVAHYGRGSDFFSLFLFPYDLLYTNSYVNGFYDYTIGKLFLIQIFATFIVLVSAKMQVNLFRRNEFIILFTFSFLHFLIWFYSSQQLRFLVPSLVIWALIMLAFLLYRNAYIILACVTFLGVFSTLSIQKDSILIALKVREFPAQAYKSEADRCFSSVENELGDNAVGYIHRDGIIGFFDRDFIFVKGSPFALDTPFNRNPEWIYMNANFRVTSMPGYILYPPSSPCIYRKI